MGLFSSDFSIYPFGELSLENCYPSTTDFQVISTGDGRGVGIKSLRQIRRGHLLCKVSGQLLASRRLHTLEINEAVHMYDPHFTGLLLHSCDPNVFLDMASLELWALKDIVRGDLLCMDYAVTEGTLMRQFACQCGSPNCRLWITGSKEPLNEEGKKFLGQLNCDCDSAVGS
ncbi:lysine methyltransferase [Pseudomonas sp. GCEP-101]|uniref:lysine methyltransferase n=1 Tax=Pseudomonas sp. GCEP-101 TaxID=2974552 RepID=UPI00223BB0EA|nr:lysine methyltransferase [Pseudomonas sp. GCEP-101]